MSLTHYPQTLNDVQIGLRLLCNDEQSLRSLAYTKPLYAIVINKFTVNGELFARLKFVTRKGGDFITQHDYHCYVQNGTVYFQQVQSLYDLLIVAKPLNLKLISS